MADRNGSNGQDRSGPGLILPPIIGGLDVDDEAAAQWSRVVRNALQSGRALNSPGEWSHWHVGAASWKPVRSLYVWIWEPEARPPDRIEFSPAGLAPVCGTATISIVVAVPPGGARTLPDGSRQLRTMNAYSPAMRADQQTADAIQRLAIAGAAELKEEDLWP